MTVVAHAGHGLVELVYLAPLAVLVAAVLIGRRRERRRERSKSDPDHE